MRLLITPFILVAVVSTGHAQVFRCTSPDGKLTFSDGGCPPGTQGTLNRPSPRPPSEAAAREVERERAAERERRARAAEARTSEHGELQLQRERIEIERQRAALERERAALKQQSRRDERENEVPAGQGATIPAQTGPDSYACEVAKRNLGVGINAESKARSQREYEVACFGAGAANIEAARQGRPQININIRR